MCTKPARAELGMEGRRVVFGKYLASKVEGNTNEYD
jgi:hypothetical protein